MDYKYLSVLSNKFREDTVWYHIKLKEHVVKLRDSHANSDWNCLRDLALRFCLGNSFASTVLVGVSNMKELKFALESVKKDFLEKKGDKVYDPRIPVGPPKLID